MIEQGDGTFAKREKLGLCVRCEVILIDGVCQVCGLSISKIPRQTSVITKLSHYAKPEGYRIHELKCENKKGHA
tara:strand:- start:232 stop:453 length:222 start_codon:yes stop_codon:yes gene_type:complete